VGQVLALFNKAMRKATSNLRTVVETEVAKGLPQSSRHIQMTPTKMSLEEDLQQGASEYRQEMEDETKKLLADPSLKQFAVGGKDEDWEAIGNSGEVPSSISVKSANGKRKPTFQDKKPTGGRGGRGGHGGHNNNKKPFKRGGKQ
jgi:N-acetyltransferase 10